MKASLNLSFLILIAKSKAFVFTGYEEMVQLPALNGNPNTLTMSGFSSGAMMSTQMQVAFSQEIKGIGIESSTPYMSISSPYKDGDSSRNF